MKNKGFVALMVFGGLCQFPTLTYHTEPAVTFAGFVLGFAVCAAIGMALDFVPNTEEATNRDRRS